MCIVLTNLTNANKSEVSFTAGLDSIVLQAYFSHVSQNTQTKTQEWAVIHLPRAYE